MISRHFFFGDCSTFFVLTIKFLLSELEFELEFEFGFDFDFVIVAWFYSLRLLAHTYDRVDE